MGADSVQIPPKPTLADFGLTGRQVAEHLRPKPPRFGLRLAAWCENAFVFVVWIATIAAIIAWILAFFTRLIPAEVLMLAPFGILALVLLGAVLLGLLPRLLPVDPIKVAYDGYTTALRDWEMAIANERNRQEREHRRKRRDWWRSLSGRAFEHEVAETLHRCGHEVRVLGGRSDGGVDLLIDSKVIAQCKAHRTRVGPTVVRELCGALQMFGARSAILVAREGCSDDASRLAEEQGIRVLCLDDLIDLEANKRRVV